MSVDPSINLKITAENQAAQAFREAEMQAKKMVQGVQEVGDQSKRTTELVGALASSLGGSRFGAFAGEVSTIIDRVKEFRFSLEKGGAGAVAFGVATGAAVAAVAVQVGQAIGSMIWQVERWKKELATAKEKWADLQSGIAKNVQSRLDKEVKDIKDMADLTNRRAAAEAKVLEIRNNMAAKEQQLNSLRRQRNELADKWIQTEENKASIDILDQQIKDRREEYKALYEARESLRGEGLDKESEAKLKEDQERRIQNSQKYIQQLREEAQIQAATGETRARLELERAGVFGEEDFQAGLKLRKELDAIAEQSKRQAEAEAKRKRDEQERLASAKKRLELEFNSLNGLKQQAIALTDSKAAAEAFANEMAGMDKATAKRVADLKQRLGDLQSAARQSSLASSLTATNQRLITGKGAEFRKSAADIESARQTKLQEDSKKILGEINAAIQNLQPVRLQVLGG